MNETLNKTKNGNKIAIAISVRLYRTEKVVLKLNLVLYAYLFTKITKKARIHFFQVEENRRIVHNTSQ